MNFVNGLFLWASFFLVLSTAIMAIEGLNVQEAWYLTCITITTVGFGDIVPQGRLGRLVVMAGTMCSILVFSSVLASVVESVFGRWHRKALWGLVAVCVGVLAHVEEMEAEDALWVVFQTVSTVG